MTHVARHPEITPFRPHFGAWFRRRRQLRVDRIDAGWRSWTNEKSLWHRVCLHPAFVEGLCPAPYVAPVPAWRRQPQGIPNEPTIILRPEGGGRGNSRQDCRWCRVARADRDSQVSALGVSLPSGAPFRCKHRIMHRKRGPGQRGPKIEGFGVGRGFAIWSPFRCAHRIAHRKRGPGQQGLRGGRNLLGRNLDGNQIAWRYRACAGHSNLLFRDGVKCQAGTVIAYH